MHPPDAHNDSAGETAAALPSEGEADGTPPVDDATLGATTTAEGGAVGIASAGDSDGGGGDVTGGAEAKTSSGAADPFSETAASSGAASAAGGIVIGCAKPLAPPYAPGVVGAEISNGDTGRGAMDTAGAGVT